MAPEQAIALAKRLNDKETEGWSYTVNVRDDYAFVKIYDTQPSGHSA